MGSLVCRGGVGGKGFDGGHQRVGWTTFGENRFLVGWTDFGVRPVWIKGAIDGWYRLERGVTAFGG